MAILQISRECSKFRGRGGGGVGEPGEGRDIFQKELMGIICAKTEKIAGNFHIADH